MISNAYYFQLRIQLSFHNIYYSRQLPHTHTQPRTISIISIKQWHKYQIDKMSVKSSPAITLLFKYNCCLDTTTVHMEYKSDLLFV